MKKITVNTKKAEGFVQGHLYVCPTDNDIFLCTKSTTSDKFEGVVIKSHEYPVGYSSLWNGRYFVESSKPITIGEKVAKEQVTKFKKGELYLGEDTGQIVLCTEDSGGKLFSGVNVNGVANEAGYYSTSWMSSCFVKFTGSVLLED